MRVKLKLAFDSPEARERIEGFCLTTDEEKRSRWIGAELIFVSNFQASHIIARFEEEGFEIGSDFAYFHFEYNC